MSLGIELRCCGCCSGLVGMFCMGVVAGESVVLEHVLITKCEAGPFGKSV